MSDAPTPYGEFADVIVNLGLIVREARRARGLSQRAAATQMGGQSYSTISRVENGAACDSTSLLLILRWLDLTVAPAAGSAATPPQAACAESSLLAWGQHLLASQPEAGDG